MKLCVFSLAIALAASQAFATECKCPPAEEQRDEMEFEDVPDYKRGEPFHYQEHRLNRAYLDSSHARLENFFAAWADRSQPLSEREIAQLPPAFQHAYKIYADFYQPKNLGRIGDPEWGTDQFAKVRYFITQPTIEVWVTDKLVKDTHAMDAPKGLYRATLQDFRPRIQGDVPALFLDSFHQGLLEGFLGSEELPLGHNGIMSPSQAAGESLKRLKFLNQFVQIYHGHWSGWRLGTDPTISTINFNRDFTRAIVHFALVYQGGEALYEYKNGKWHLKNSRLTWIT